MLVPRAWRELLVWGCQAVMLVPCSWKMLWAWGCRRPCWFPRHGKSCGPRASTGNVVSQGMAGAVGPGLPLAMLVPMPQQELWVWGCRRPCRFSGHSGSCGTEGAAGHVGSRGMEGAVGPGLPPAMLVPGAWRELWAQVCCHPCWFPGMVQLWARVCCRPCWFPGHSGSCGPRSAKWPCWL